MEKDRDPLDFRPQDLEEAREDRLGKILARCSDLLNEGRDLDTQAILRENPDLAEDLAAALRSLRKIGAGAGDGRALGVLGDYRLLRQIGRGGMGVVYEAWQSSMDRRVALKVLPSGVAADQKTFLRFMREARTAGKLNHQHIVSVHAMGVDENTPYYAMEFVDGETLAQILSRLRAGKGEHRTGGAESPLDTEEVTPLWCFRVAEAFAGVAEGLQHAHEKGVIHRDLKPSNLILDKAGRLRILDFGLAHLEGQESLTASGDFLGTPLYMSPEQARARKAPIDHRTDIYSLGATLYEVLAGRPPFQGKDHQDTLSQILSRDPPLIRKGSPRVPKELETIVLKCLRKEPGDRYGTAEALAQDLRRFVRGDPIEARPQPGWMRLRRKLARHRLGILVGISLLLLATVSGLLYQKYRIEKAAEIQAFYGERVIDAAMLLEMGELTMQAASNKVLSIDPQNLFMPGDFLALTDDGDLSPTDSALGKLSEAKEILPRRPEAYYHFARGLIQKGQAEGALQELDRALGMASDFIPAKILELRLRREAGVPPVPGEEDLEGFSSAAGGWGEIWLKAHEALGARDWKEAALLYSKLIQEFREREEPFLGASVEFHLGRGRALLEAGELSGAIESFVAARTLWPGAKVPQLLLGKAYFLKGERGNAEEAFDRLFENAGSLQDEIVLWVAALYKNLGSYEKGLRWAERMKGESLRLRLQVDFLNLLGRFEEAIRIGREAIRKFPMDSRTHTFLAVALLRTPKGAKEAVEAARRAWEMDPERADALCVYATALQFAGEPVKAEEHFLKALEMAPDESRAYDHLARLLWQQGRLDEAEERYRQAIEVMERVGRRRHFLNPYGNLARFLLERGRIEEAIIFDEKAALKDPDTGFYFKCLGILKKQMGRIEEARTEFLRSLEIDPGDSRSQRQLGTIHLMKGETEEAVPLFREALRLEPKYTATVQDLARSLEKLGKDGEAFSTYLEALRSGPRDRETFEGLQDLHRRRGGSGAFADLWDEVASVLESFDPEVQAKPGNRSVLALALACGKERRDLDRALELAAEAVEVTARKIPDLLANLGEVEFLRGNGERAVLLLEEALSNPQARGSLGVKLEDCRKAILPNLVSFASVEWALDSLGGDREKEGELLERFRGLAKDRRAKGLLAYFEGLVLERMGRFKEGTEKYIETMNLGWESPRIFVRLCACSRGDGDLVASERILHQTLETKYPENVDLWNLWMAVLLADLGRPPEEVLELLPSKIEAETRPSETAGAESRYGDGCRWLLERLAAGEAIRINCGGEEYRDPSGAVWGKDRFFRGGRARSSPNCDIAGTDDDPIYRDGRWFFGDERPLLYRIPLPRGTYRITLHFSETVLWDHLQRLLDVRIEGERALSGCDPSKAGFAAATRESMEADVEDGLLDIEFTAKDEEGLVSAIEVAPVER